MKQGSTFVLIVNLNIDLSRINSVIFTLKNKDVTLTKENWTYNNGNFELPFTQEETVQLQGRTRIEAQINFADGNVAKTQIKDIYIQETLATRIIEDNIATQEGREVELLVEEDVIYTSEDYSKLENKPKINGVVLLGNVSLDELNIASKDFVEEEIAKFDFIKIVTALPDEGLPNRTYLVAKTNGADNDFYDEYIWTNNGWEYIGTKQIEVDLSEYVKNTDYATGSKAGVIKTSEHYGIVNVGGGLFALNRANNDEIASRTQIYKPITSANLDYAVKAAMCDGKGAAWTEEEKAASRERTGSASSEEVQSAKATADNALSVAKGRATAYIFETTAELDTKLQDTDFVSNLVKGDNFYIKAIDEPDYWWDGTEKQPLETEKPDLTNVVKNVQINGESIVGEDGVAEIPFVVPSSGSNAASSTPGVIKLKAPYYSGLMFNEDTHSLEIMQAPNSVISNRDDSTLCKEVITTSNVDYALKKAMTDGKGPAWTTDEQEAARRRIGEPQFELIEEINLEEDVNEISRSVDLSGNAYNFKIVLFEIYVKGGTSINIDAKLFLNGDTDCRAIMRNLLQKHDMYGVLCASTRGGLLKTFCAFSSSLTSAKSVDSNINLIQMNNITSVKITCIGGSIPTGSIIKIYGMRD